MMDTIENLPEIVKRVLQQFNEFQLSEFNDSGANGYVLIGRHDVLNKDVAIKIYFHEENDIDQEPAIIAGLNHENILKVFDARKLDKDSAFYMMQAANDGDLFSFQERYHLSLALSYKLLCQLLSGLAVMHCEENSLVHRDLKPENLLVHDDHLVIADFGSVRRIDRAVGKVNASKNSILYKPPESIGQNGFFDFSSDIYQAGIIGYRLFGGVLHNELMLYLNHKERGELENIKKTQGDFEVSKYIDNCIEQKIIKGKLLNWDSMPFYVPTKILRILKKSVSLKGKRYDNVSEILMELSQFRPGLPDWIIEKEIYKLRNWHGNDYMLYEYEGMILMKKCKSGSNNFRLDKRIKATSYKAAYIELKSMIGLP